MRSSQHDLMWRQLLPKVRKHDEPLQVQLCTAFVTAMLDGRLPGGTRLPSSRDLAMLVAEDVSAADIEKVIAKNAGKHFKEVCLFDVYTGKQIEAGKKSLAFTMQFQSKDKTLTDEEADAAFQNILGAVQKEFNAELRA